MKKKMIVVAVVVLLAVIAVAPSVSAYGVYSGSCMRYFYTDDEVTHSFSGWYKHRNDHNYFGDHSSGAKTTSENWFNAVGGGAVDSAHSLYYSHDEFNMYTRAGTYNLAVENAGAYNVERMYSQGYFE